MSNNGARDIAKMIKSASKEMARHHFEGITLGTVIKEDPDLRIQPLTGGIALPAKLLRWTTHTLQLKESLQKGDQVLMAMSKKIYYILGEVSFDGEEILGGSGGGSPTTAEFDAHVALTTSAHGGIVASTDPRLTDARTPTAHIHPQSDITGLTSALAAKQDASTAATDAELAVTQGDLNTHKALTTTAHGGIVASTDPRLTDSRAPSGAAGGVLSGTYPNPAFAADMATQAELDAHTSLTTSAHGGIVASTDPRLTDARTPLAHIHPQSDITGLTAALAAKQDASTAATDAELAVTQGDLNTHKALTTSAHGGIVASTDPRLTDSRAPTGTAGGVLNGTYPNPGFAVDMALQSELDAHAAITTSAHGGIVASTDPRLTDARTPTSHAASHISGAADEVDGDVVDIDFVPTKYVSTTGTPGTNSAHLSAHLRGIDQAIENVIVYASSAPDPTKTDLWIDTTMDSGSIVVLNGGHIGDVFFWAFPGALPDDVVECAGQQITASYPLLRAKLIAEGSPWGTTSGNPLAPNYQGRVLVGKDGATFATVGATGGLETVTLTSSQSGMPSHTVSGTTGDDSPDHIHNSPLGSPWVPLSWRASGGGLGFTSGPFDFGGTGLTGASARHQHTFTGTASAVGAAQGHTNLQPYAVGRWVIRANNSYTDQSGHNLVQSPSYVGTGQALIRTAQGTWVPESLARQQDLDDLRTDFEDHNHDDRYLNPTVITITQTTLDSDTAGTWHDIAGGMTAVLKPGTWMIVFNGCPRIWQSGSAYASGIAYARLVDSATGAIVYGETECGLQCAQEQESPAVCSFSCLVSTKVDLPVKIQVAFGVSVGTNFASGWRWDSGQGMPAVMQLARIAGI